MSTKKKKTALRWSLTGRPGHLAEQIGRDNLIYSNHYHDNQHSIKDLILKRRQHTCERRYNNVIRTAKMEVGSYVILNSRFYCANRRSR